MRKPAQLDNHFNILGAGRFTQKQVQIRWFAGERDLRPEISVEMEAHWEEQIEKCEESSFIFNGELCRLEDWTCKADALKLHLKTTNYKELLYSNRFADQIVDRFGPAFLSRALGVSLVLQTRNAEIIMIERSTSVGEEPGRLDVVGGHIEPSQHCVAGLPSPFLAIQEEILEEIGLRSHDHDQLACIGLIETRLTRKPEMIFAGKSHLDTSRIIASASEVKSREIARTFAVPVPTLRDFLFENLEKLSPSAIGALWLHHQTQPN